MARRLKSHPIVLFRQAQGAKQADPGGLDEIDLRIRQASVTANDGQVFPSAASYTDVAFNFAKAALPSTTRYRVGARRLASFNILQYRRALCSLECAPYRQHFAGQHTIV